MRTIKNFMVGVFAALILFNSCTNNDELLTTPVPTEESASVSKALDELNKQFNGASQGFSNQNPTSNIVFDFGFNFVYPITLSYNTGSTVEVNSFEELTSILDAITPNLFINGITFPFDVEVYNQSSNAIEIITITNEQEFINLLSRFNFDDPDDCVCTQEFDPVFVEVQIPTGETIVISFPNACYALCAGFTEDDFIDNPQGVNFTGNNPCFNFNYPITLVLDTGSQVTVNSEQEFLATIYTSHYFDFVYPFSLTLSDTNEVVTVNSADDFNQILDNCYSNGDFNPTDCIEGEGAIVNNTISVSNFTDVRILVNGNVTINQGAFQLDYSVEESIIQYVSSTVNNNVLEVKLVDGCYLNYDLDVTITLPDLNYLHIISNANLTINGFDQQTETLKIFQQGNGNSFINTFEGITTLDLTVQGNGSFKANQDITSIQNLNIQQQGNSNIALFTISSPNVSVNSQSSSGVVEVTATNTLNAIIQGGGNVYYKGNPTITQTIMGSGGLIDAN